MTVFMCAGNPPKVPPCGADITTEAAAERHAKTGHTVISATSTAVLDRYLAREENPRCASTSRAR